MKIVVLVKETPDTAELPNVSVAEAQSGSISGTVVINPWDEFAAEEAIDMADRFDGNATAISMAPTGSTEALKHVLAMGVGSATLVEHDALHEIDEWATASLLAAAIRQQGDVDVVLAGKQGVDGNSGSVFVGVARQLGFPLLVNVSKIVDVADGTITVQRIVDGGQETVTAPLPVVISVAKEINDPRYPSFMGIRKASRAKIPTIAASDLSDAETGATTSWTHVRKPEERTTDVTVIEGDSVTEKAAKLADALMAEKVI